MNNSELIKKAYEHSPSDHSPEVTITLLHELATALSLYGWQPMETAPKTGLTILCNYGLDFVCIVWWSSIDKVWTDGTSSYQPTLWHFLPLSPRGQHNG